MYNHVIVGATPAICEALTAFETVQNDIGEAYERNIQSFHDKVRSMPVGERQLCLEKVGGIVETKVNSAAARLGIPVDNNAVRDAELTKAQEQLSGSEWRYFQIHQFLHYFWSHGVPDSRLLFISTLNGELFFLTPNIRLESQNSAVIKKIHEMLAELFSYISYQDFQRLALPLYHNIDCYLHLHLTGNVPRYLRPMEDIECLSIKYSGRQIEPEFIRELFELHYLLQGMYLDGDTNCCPPF